MFHVKHTPVQEVAPITWALLEEPVHVGAYHLERQCVDEINSAGIAIAVSTIAYSAFVTTYAKPM
ncbi:hypothetical protein SSPSH_000409 [Salinisphaera shabanensis E1L3A]|uniref:Uncharacterized protein n=1 Tax=Salinisphaera shabanensis E1L3A TaxID=1033802 RepID=U2FWM9_9GAMM|nr:hypothetical protein SSPSH_000409 [Salinisphaera shabanensis E1L3A]